MKLKRIIAACISAIIICTFSIHSFADFGNFDTYDSGGWDSGSDWDSRWDSDWSSSGSGYYSDADFYYDDDYDDEDGLAEFFIAVAVIALIVFISYKKFKKNGGASTSYSGRRATRTTQPVIEYANKNASIGETIRANDPAFNTEKFLAFVNEAYVKLQTAWCDRDLEPVRLILTEEMLAQMTPAVEQYKKLGRINMMERIAVQNSYMTDYSSDNEKEALTVYLYATQKDYIIDEKTKQVLEGSSTDFRHSKYLITLIRAKGEKTESADGIKAENCPNCGAPLEITASGKCAYCDSVISNDDHSWVVAVMKRVN